MLCIPISPLVRDYRPYAVTQPALCGHPAHNLDGDVVVPTAPFGQLDQIRAHPIQRHRFVLPTDDLADLRGQNQVGQPVRTLDEAVAGLEYERFGGDVQTWPVTGTDRPDCMNASLPSSTRTRWVPLSLATL